MPYKNDVGTRDGCQELLRSARGRLFDDKTTFHYTLWGPGAWVTKGGALYVETIPHFTSRVLASRVDAVAEKRAGWYFCPTRTTDGHKCNESVITVDALTLDCDGAGTWERLLIALMDLDYAYIAYQTGGWTEAKPKWRVMLPLDQPYDAATEEKREAWKAIYRFACAVFSKVGDLSPPGLDQTTCPVSIAWFLNERRRVCDPPRRYLFRLGHSLDLAKLAEAMPPVPPPPPRAPHVPRPALNLDETMTGRIVSALAKVTESVPAGRRKLYREMTNALLAVDIAPDDALDIIEDVSDAHGGDPQKHKDNVGYARWVIHRFENKKWKPDLGNLYKEWPAVMAALASAIPETVEARRKAYFAAKDEADAIWFASKRPPPPIQPPPPPTMNRDPPLSAVVAMCGHLPPDPPRPPTPPKPPKRTPLRKLAARIVKKSATNEAQKNAGIFLDRLLHGEAVLQAQDDAAVRARGADVAVAQAVKLLGWGLPLDTSWIAVHGDIVHLGLMSTDRDLLTDGERMKVIESAFVEGQTRRREWDAKCAAERARAQKTIDAYWKSYATRSR